MNITRYGHACLLVEEGTARILTDPGTWNDTPNVEHLDAILITHEHQDHVAVEQVKEILAKNPTAIIVTHEGVRKVLDAAELSYTPIEENGSITIKDVPIESFGTQHAPIYGASPCRNTGFLIGEKLFIPGDALDVVPPKQVAVLALPTGGPWMKISEAIDYAKRLKPQVAFPIHDAMYIKEFREENVPFWLESRLAEDGITFKNILPGTSATF